MSVYSLNDSRCMVLSVRTVLDSSLITDNGGGLFDSVALLLDHVVSKDVVAVAPDRLVLQTQTLLHERLPLCRA